MRLKIHQLQQENFSAVEKWAENDFSGEVGMNGPRPDGGQVTSHKVALYHLTVTRGCPISHPPSPRPASPSPPPQTGTGWACRWCSFWQFLVSSLWEVCKAFQEISPQASSPIASSLPTHHPADDCARLSSLTVSPFHWAGVTSQAGRWQTWGRCTGSAPPSPRRRRPRSSSASWRARCAYSPTGSSEAPSSCRAARPAVVSSLGKDFSVLETLVKTILTMII